MYNWKIVNMTPHEVNIIMQDGTEIKIPPSGETVRVAEKSTVVGYINGIPVIKKTFGAIEELPPKQEDTIYIVSLLAAKAISTLYIERHDFFAIGEAVRNEKGQVVGAKSLVEV